MLMTCFFFRMIISVPWKKRVISYRLIYIYIYVNQYINDYIVTLVFNVDVKTYPGNHLSSKA